MLPIFLLLLVMLVTAAKTVFEKQALILGTKQNKQADKAGRQTWQAG
jgi:hypothetical protein